MNLKPKEVLKTKLSYFEAQGPRMKDYPLIRAVYFEDFEKARTILESDPDQINSRDPYAGLTPLHIAIFRENQEMIDLLLNAKGIDASVRDGFGRRPIDIADYIQNNQIFLQVTKTHTELL